MDFLKEVLGDELFNQFSEKVNAYNGNEANKEKLIKLVNLTDGGYVSKDKYGTLETDYNGKVGELTKAQELIEEMKKSTGKDTELQGKITDYETTIATLQQENETLKTENALKFALKDAGAVDVEYLVFKAKEKGELKLGEDGKIKGIDELVTGLKTQLPSQFETKQQRKVEERRLPSNDEDGDGSITKADFLKKSYNERVQFKQEHPEQYTEIMKG